MLFNLSVRAHPLLNSIKYLQEQHIVGEQINSDPDGLLLQHSQLT